MGSAVRGRPQTIGGINTISSAADTVNQLDVTANEHLPFITHYTLRQQDNLCLVSIFIQARARSAREKQVLRPDRKSGHGRTPTSGVGATQHQEHGESRRG